MKAIAWASSVRMGGGKSTLLKILADVVEPDDGEIVRRRGLKIVYVEQDDRFSDGATPLSAVTGALVNDDNDRVDVETRGSITLSKLGFVNFDRPVATLSGGWRKRLSLACALSRPDAGVRPRARRRDIQRDVSGAGARQGAIRSLGGARGDPGRRMSSASSTHRAKRSRHTMIVQKHRGRHHRVSIAMAITGESSPQSATDEGLKSWGRS